MKLTEEQIHLFTELAVKSNLPAWVTVTVIQFLTEITSIDTELPLNVRAAQFKEITVDAPSYREAPSTFPRIEITLRVDSFIDVKQPIYLLHN